MSRRRAMLVSAITIGVWPVVVAYAADPALHPQTEAPVIPQQQTQPALDLPHAFAGIRPEGRAAGLRLDVEPRLFRHDEARHGPPANAASPSTRPEDLRYWAIIDAASASSRPMNPGTGYASPVASGSRLNLSRAPYAPKPGWEMSGRVGPLRWLSPIDGEGETQVRLGGRVQGQPRMPGMGLFNVGIHYNFE